MSGQQNRLRYRGEIHNRQIYIYIYIYIYETHFSCDLPDKDSMQAAYSRQSVGFSRSLLGV